MFPQNARFETQRLFSQRCLSFDHAVSRRGAGPEVAPRSAAPFGVSFAVLEIWENVETRASAQTTTFPDPNFCALQARRPDWGATPRPALRREYRFGGFFCGEDTRSIFCGLFLECFGPPTQVNTAQPAMQLIVFTSPTTQPKHGLFQTKQRTM